MARNTPFITWIQRWFKGADVTADAGKDSYKGIKVGSEVVVESTKKGTVDTADEIDKLSKDTVKTVDGTVVKIGKGGKTVTVKTADGTEKVFETGGKGAEISVKSVGKGAAVGTKVTVTYTEKAVALARCAFWYRTKMGSTLRGELPIFC